MIARVRIGVGIKTVNWRIGKVNFNHDIRCIGAAVGITYDWEVMNPDSTFSPVPARFRPWLKWGLIFLFGLWMALALGAYYVAQKPFDPVQLAQVAATRDVWLRLPFSPTAVVRSLLDLLTAVWLAWVALGVGLWALRRLQLRPESDLATAVFGIGLGFGMLALGMLGLGVLGLLQTAVFLGLLVLLTLLTGPAALRFWRQHFRPARPPRALGLYLLLVGGMALLAALLPPHSWDGLSYHLKGPQLYLAAGRIQPVPDPAHLAPIHFPNLFEMLFMLAMGIRGDAVAHLLHFLFAFFLGGMVYLAARDTVQVRQPWLAVLFYVAMPLTLALASIAYNDLSFAFFQLGALFALLQWQKEGRAGWLAAAGIFCGLAMGHKYTSFVTPLALAALLVWGYRGQWRRAARPLLQLTLITTLVAAPWYLKNIWLTGNPVYPFVFAGAGWDAFLSLAYADPGSGIDWDLIALLRLPYDLTIGINDVSGDGQVGPFFLIFLPLLLLFGLTRMGRGAPRPWRQYLFFALVQYLFWTVGVINSAGLNQTRQLFSAFVVLCPVLAWVLEALAAYDHPQFSLKRFMGLVLAFALVLNLVGYVLAWLPKAPHAYALGSDTRAETLARLLGIHYVALAGVNAVVPDEGVVQFLWEPRSYYCQVDCRPDVLLYKFTHLEHLYEEAPAIAGAWRAEGVTHVLIFEAGYAFAVANEMAFIAPQETAVVDELRQNWLETVAAWPDGYTLYALRP